MLPRIEDMPPGTSGFGASDEGEGDALGAKARLGAE